MLNLLDAFRGYGFTAYVANVLFLACFPVAILLLIAGLWPIAFVVLVVGTLFFWWTRIWPVARSILKPESQERFGRSDDEIKTAEQMLAGKRRGPHETPESDAAATWTSLAEESYCYLTTLGRRTGEPHTIEIWFVLRGHTMYLLSGAGRRSDWVRNLMQTSDVVVRIGGQRFSGRGRMVNDPDEERLVRDLLPAKYRPGYTGDLSNWQRRALPVAIELSPLGDDA